MRGSVDGLGSSAPIGAMLPAIFADDDLAQRFVAGLDEVLAPFLVVLDNLDSYFDPALAPLDFTRWLADWVGAETEGIETEGAGTDGAGPGGASGAGPGVGPAGASGAGPGTGPALAGTDGVRPGGVPGVGPADAGTADAGHAGGGVGGVGPGADPAGASGAGSGVGPALAESNGVRPGVGRAGVEADGVRPGGGPVSSGGIASGIGPVSRGTADAGRAGALPAELRLRAAVAAAARLHRVRGTRRGLSEAVRLVFGVPPEIRESGAAAWHARPLGPVPGDRRPHLHVTLRLPDPTPADHHRLDTLVAAARPAHMPYTVEVVASAVAERTTDR